MKTNLSYRIPNSSDIDFLLELENDPEMMKVSGAKQAYSRQEIIQFIKLSQHDLLLENQLRMMIINPDTKKPVGCVDFFQYNPIKAEVGIGIGILKKYRKQGYALAAIQYATQILAKKHKIKTVFCHIHIDNQKSISLFNKAGFVFKKFIPQWEIEKDYFCDVNYFEFKV